MEMPESTEPYEQPVIFNEMTDRSDSVSLTSAEVADLAYAYAKDNDPFA